MIVNLTAFTTTTTGCNPHSDGVRVLPGVAGNDNSNAKNGAAVGFLPHLTRHTETNGNKVDLLKTLGDEGDHSTLLCNGRDVGFPFAASPQLQLRVPHPSVLRVGLSFAFACAFVFRCHPDRAKRRGISLSPWLQVRRWPRAELPVGKVGAIMNPLAVNWF